MSFINQSFVIIQLDSNLGNVVLLSFLVMINIITVGGCPYAACCTENNYCCSGNYEEYCPPPDTPCVAWCIENGCPMYFPGSPC
jgi:hypothetical protein